MTPNEAKRAVFNELVSKEASVHVHFDPRHELADVPAHLQHNPQCAFQYGYDMPQPIVGMRSTDVHLIAILMFKGKSYECFVPWESVFLIVGNTSQRGRLWQEAMPAELAHAAAEAQRLNADKLVPPQAPPAPPRSNVVSMDEASRRLRGRALRSRR